MVIKFDQPRPMLLTGLGVGLVAVAMVSQFNPTTHSRFFPQCLIHQATGLYCAGCGATRALFALTHGHLEEALRDNVLFVLTLPLLGWALGKTFIPAFLKNRWPSAPSFKPISHLPALGIFLVTILTFMVLRNLPGPEFSFLRPL